MSRETGGFLEEFPFDPLVSSFKGGDLVDFALGRQGGQILSLSLSLDFFGVFPIFYKGEGEEHDS